MGIISIFNLPADFACYFKGCRQIDVIPSILCRSIHPFLPAICFPLTIEMWVGNNHEVLLKDLKQILHCSPQLTPSGKFH